MRKIVLCILMLASFHCFGQADTAKWIRAFPITDYIKDLKDSVRLVQLNLPNGPVLRDKQLGLLRGVYADKHSDTVTVGAGRCVLIKGDYYYFSITQQRAARAPKQGDLLYTMVEKPVAYTAQIVRVASHWIGLTDVYDKQLFDRSTVFYKWRKIDEEALLDSMVADIQFTGNYFLTNNPAMNVEVTGGKYKGKMVLNTMIVCRREDVVDFLDYMIARPRLYAGRDWKISEVFATWLSAGAPTVIKEK